MRSWLAVRRYKYSCHKARGRSAVVCPPRLNLIWLSFKVRTRTSYLETGLQRIGEENEILRNNLIPWLMIDDAMLAITGHYDQMP